jgi:hypothetical protein
MGENAGETAAEMLLQQFQGSTDILLIISYRRLAHSVVYIMKLET